MIDLSKLIANFNFWNKFFGMRKKEPSFADIAENWMKPIFELQEVAQKLRYRKNVNALDKRALLAILDERSEEADRLLGQMKTRNKLGISIVATTYPR